MGHCIGLYNHKEKINYSDICKSNEEKIKMYYIKK